MMRNLELERLTLAAMSLGIARRSLDEVNSDAAWAGGSLAVGLLFIVDPGNMFREEWHLWAGLMFLAMAFLFFMSGLRGEANLARCSACKNDVHKDATVCSHCGSEFD